MSLGYILCATPRSGSTLLCGLLKSAGAGDPHSFFRAEDLDDWAEGWGLPPRAAAPAAVFEPAYLAAAIRAGRGGTAVFGLRLMQATLPDLLAWLDRAHPGLPSDRARLEAAFGPLRFVHLARGDRVAQAVSLVRARQTGLWHRAADGSELERTAPPAPPRFDAAAIGREHAALQAAEAGWAAWFAAEGISPLRLRYEDLAADPAAALARVLAVLGLPAPAQALPPTARLADATSAEWAARFRAR